MGVNSKTYVFNEQYCNTLFNIVKNIINKYSTYIIQFLIKIKPMQQQVTTGNNR